MQQPPPIAASYAPYLRVGINERVTKRTKRLEAMRIRMLVAENKSHGAVKSLKTWKGEKYELLQKVRIAEEQSYAVGMHPKLIAS